MQKEDNQNAFATLGMDKILGALKYVVMHKEMSEHV
jgi:hypothetical protein